MVVPYEVLARWKVIAYWFWALVHLLVFNFGAVPERSRNEHFDTTTSFFYWFRLFAPISRHFPESSFIISLHSILYTRILHTEVSTILETARSKRNSGESCSNIWLTFRIIQNVTLNTKLVGNVTCAVRNKSAPGAQTAACDVDATWRESSLGAYYRGVRR